MQATFKLLSYICHFFIDPLLLEVANSGATNVGNELGDVSSVEVQNGPFLTCVSPRILVAILAEVKQ